MYEFCLECGTPTVQRRLNTPHGVVYAEICPACGADAIDKDQATADIVAELSQRRQLIVQYIEVTFGYDFFSMQLMTGTDCATCLSPLTRAQQINIGGDIPVLVAFCDTCDMVFFTERFSPTGMSDYPTVEDVERYLA